MLKLKSFNVPIYGAQCLIVFTDLSNDEASEKLAKYNVDWIPNTIKEMDKSADFIVLMIMVHLCYTIKKAILPGILSLMRFFT